MNKSRVYLFLIPPSQPSPRGEGDHFPFGGNKKGGKYIKT
jgi:hypothetical protein